MNNLKANETVETSNSKILIPRTIKLVIIM